MCHISATHFSDKGQINTDVCGTSLLVQWKGTSEEDGALGKLLPPPRTTKALNSTFEGCLFIAGDLVWIVTWNALEATCVRCQALSLLSRILGNLVATWNEPVFCRFCSHWFGLSDLKVARIKTMFQCVWFLYTERRQCTYTHESASVWQSWAWVEIVIMHRLLLLFAHPLFRALNCLYLELTMGLA